ncbi:MAG: WD40/YVTN/BNR-like repeat-containing protein [Dehalococcoidia bacterium]
MVVHLLVGTKKGAWLYTADEARRTWTVSKPIMPGWTVSHLAADTRRTPVRLFAACHHWAWGQSVAWSDDGGDTWEQRSPGLAFPEDMGISIGAMWHVAPGHASQPGVVWAGAQPAGLFKSEDWGESWKPVDGLNRHPYREFWNGAGGAGDSCLHSIQIDPRDARRMYIAISTGGSYVSDDGGETWSLISHGIVATTQAAKDMMAQAIEMFPDFANPKVPEGVDPAALDEFHKLILDTKQPDRLWGQAHVGVFVSEKRGQGWDDVTEGLPSFHGFPLAVTRNHPDYVFVVPLEFERDNFRVCAGQFAVYRSGDGGKTWQGLTNGLPGPHDYQSAYREALDTDGETPEGVYVGTTNGEIFGSSNLGERWERLPGTLPPILSITAASW